MNAPSQPTGQTAPTTQAVDASALLRSALDPTGYTKYDPQGIGQSLLGSVIKSLGEKMLLDEKYKRELAMMRKPDINFGSARQAGNAFNSRALF